MNASVKTLERTVRVDKPLDRVYDYLVDFENSEEWDAGTVRTTRTEGDGGVGTTYENVSRFMGKETTLTYVVIALEQPRTIALRGANKTVIAHDTMRLTGDGDQPRCTTPPSSSSSGSPGTSSRCSRCRSSGSVTTPRTASDWPSNGSEAPGIAPPSGNTPIRTDV